MRVIPVIDLLSGVVVHARGGRRKEYQPIQSTLTRSTHPLDVALTMLDRVKSRELYIADLDAIQHHPGRPSAAVLHLLKHLTNVTLWLDLGVTDERDTLHRGRDSFVRPIVGSETLRALDKAFDPGEAIFSLDLFQGKVLGHWQESPEILARQMVDRGYRTLILLDLAHVGSHRGPGVIPVLESLRSQAIEVELIVGGGIRDEHDLRCLAESGADGALVATAIHEGRQFLLDN